MANHFVSLNRGVSGTKSSDFTVGASSTAGNDIELRVGDAANLTKKDVILALEALEIFFETPKDVKAAGFVVTL
jgi:hypothetical protein